MIVLQFILETIAAGVVIICLFFAISLWVLILEEGGWLWPDEIRRFKGVYERWRRR